MKQLISTNSLAIPEGVDVEVKARQVRVKGPRGEFAAI
jgi:ribosomal protein L6P/L9E